MKKNKEKISGIPPLLSWDIYSEWLSKVSRVRTLSPEQLVKRRRFSKSPKR